MNAIKLRPASIMLAALTVAYAMMWVGGVGHYVLYGRPPMDAPWAASVFLALAGLLVAFTSRKEELMGLLVAASIGFTAEIIGVRYGLVFSPYRYTDVLQPQVLGAPLVMLSAWMVLVAYCRQALINLNLSRWSESALGALLMTAIDLVIDPLAANQLGYWRWERAGAYYGIPLQNFAGWFVVSFVIFIVISRKEWRENEMARYVGLSVMLFFTVIALSYGMALAGGIGSGLCLAHLAFARSSRRIE